MKNIDLLTSFINGRNDVKKVGHLSIEGNKLYNYYTCIAVREGNTIYLNNNKYSVTTTKNQNIIRRSAYNVVEMSQKELYAKFDI